MFKFVYRNKKHKSNYLVLAWGTDCTNVRDGTPVVIYIPDGFWARLGVMVFRSWFGPWFYVRTSAEFNKKFEQV